MPWPMFERIWQQERAMHDMMGALGVDPAVAARQEGGEAYSSLQANCVTCVAADTCRAWRSGADTPTEPIEFCRNYKLLKALSRLNS